MEGGFNSLVRGKGQKIETIPGGVVEMLDRMARDIGQEISKPFQDLMEKIVTRLDRLIDEISETKEIIRERAEGEKEPKRDLRRAK